MELDTSFWFRGFKFLVSGFVPTLSLLVSLSLSRPLASPPLTPSLPPTFASLKLRESEDGGRAQEYSF